MSLNPVAETIQIDSSGKYRKKGGDTEKHCLIHYK